jgi:hypothetical protein
VNATERAAIRRAVDEQRRQELGTARPKRGTRGVEGRSIDELAFEAARGEPWISRLTSP